MTASHSHKPPSHAEVKTIDAIRALTGIVEDANESITKTNTALGLETTLI